MLLYIVGVFIFAVIAIFSLLLDMAEEFTLLDLVLVFLSAIFWPISVISIVIYAFKDK